MGGLEHSQRNAPQGWSGGRHDSVLVFVLCRAEDKFLVVGITSLRCQVSTYILQGPEKGHQMLTCLLSFGLRPLFQSAVVRHPRHPPAATETSLVHLPPTLHLQHREILGTQVP